MTWTCTLAPEQGAEVVSNHKGITGARRRAAKILADEALAVLADEQAWAPRTTGALRAQVRELVTLGVSMTEYDGPTTVISPASNARVSITGGDDQPANGSRPGVRTSEARWLASAKFPQACPSCSGQVTAGERAWYDPKRGLWHERCAPAEAPR